MKITNRYTNATIYEDASSTQRETILAALAAKVSLSDANLSRADLSLIKADLFAVLNAAPAEVPGLLAAVREGRINGSKYEGECACLKGTIANVRGCNIKEMQGVLADHPDSPSERWFLAIQIGDTPDKSQVARITEEWILEWGTKQAAQREAVRG